MRPDNFVPRKTLTCISHFNWHPMSHQYFRLCDFYGCMETVLHDNNNSSINGTNPLAAPEPAPRRNIRGPMRRLLLLLHYGGGILSARRGGGARDVTARYRLVVILEGGERLIECRVVPSCCHLFSRTDNTMTIQYID